MAGINDLPPMPDRETGEPRPPRAPVDKPKPDKPVPWRSHRVPHPPQGEGPPLEWYYGTWHSQIWAFGAMFFVLFLFATLRDLLVGIDWDSAWIADPISWAIFVGTSLLSSFIVYTFTMSAGADWFMRRKYFVKTYELTSVELESDFDIGTVKLEDRYGHFLEKRLRALMANHDLWDLVYNGIRHSVANGALVNYLAMDKLQLRDVVAMRDAGQPWTPGSSQPDPGELHRPSGDRPQRNEEGWNPYRPP